MIVWLDGAFGVGKTAVAEKIMEKMPTDTIEILDADASWQERFPKNSFALPQYDTDFISCFWQEIKQHLEHEHRTIIVVMALTSYECKSGLWEKFQNESIEITHIILTAGKETIISRIEQDNCESRDSRTSHLGGALLFLSKNYEDAIRIDTEQKSEDMVADEIINLFFR